MTDEQVPELIIKEIQNLFKDPQKIPAHYYFLRGELDKQKMIDRNLKILKEKGKIA